MHPIAIGAGLVGSYYLYDRVLKPKIAARRFVASLPPKTGWAPPPYYPNYPNFGEPGNFGGWGQPMSPFAPGAALPWYSPWGPAYGVTCATPSFGPNQYQVYSTPGNQIPQGGMVAQWSNVPEGQPGSGPGSPIQGAPIGQGGLAAEWSNV